MCIIASAELTQEFGVTPMMLAFQIINLLILLLPFILAVRAILVRGKGLEIPVWIFFCFIIPVIFPIIALIHFRKSKFETKHS